MLKTNIVYVCVCMLSSVQLFCESMDYSPSGSSVRGSFRQEYWSELLFPPPGNLPAPGMRPVFLASPALAGRFFTLCLLGSLCFLIWSFQRTFSVPEIWLLGKLAGFGSSLSSLLGLCQRDRVPWEFSLNFHPNEHLLPLFLIHPLVSNASSLFVVGPIQHKEKACQCSSLAFIPPSLSYMIHCLSVLEIEELRLSLSLAMWCSVFLGIQSLQSSLHKWSFDPILSFLFSSPLSLPPSVLFMLFWKEDLCCKNICL